MTYSIDTNFLQISVASCVSLIVFCAAIFLIQRHAITRKISCYLGFAWVFTWSIEYWIFGKNSFIFYYDEANAALPQLLYRINQFPEGTFFHPLLSGVDADAASQMGGQLLSLEVILLSLLPLWISILVHKLIVVTTSFAGTYILMRRACICDRLIALAFAAIYSVSFPYLYNVTIIHGIGYAAIPLAIYIFVTRLDSVHYYRWALPFIVIYAISSSISHSTLALFPAVLCASFLFTAQNWRRLLLGLSILMFSLLINWHEALFGMLTYGEYSARIAVGHIQYPFLKITEAGWGFFSNKIDSILLAIGLASLIILWFFHEKSFALRATITSLLSLFGGSFLTWFPWDVIGLGFLQSLNFNYISFSYPALLIVIAGKAVMSFRDCRWPLFLKAFPSAVLFAIACYFLVNIKIFNLVAFFGDGGQSNLTSIPNLVKRDWAPKALFRVVTVPYKIYPNFMLAYGLDMFDGFTNLVPLKYVDTWHRGVLRLRTPKPDSYIGGDLYITQRHNTDFRGHASFDITNWVDVNWLRLGNVSHVVSYVPLHGGGIKKVSGPVESPTSRRSLSFTTKLSRDFSRIFNPRKVYIYSVPNPLPRVYFAKGLKIVPDALNHDKFLLVVSNVGPDKIAVMRESESPLLLHKSFSGTVTNVKKTADGFDIDVDAPSGGIIVVNTLALPFWTADVDGESAPIASVNNIHMAIAVKPGAKRILFRYKRPTLRDKILHIFPGLS